MIMKFPYQDIPDLEIPQENLIGFYRPRKVEVKKSEEEIIREGLAEPIGRERLSKMVKGKERVLIIADDLTRTTPLSRILPFVLEELFQGGIKKDNIKILIGLGTHREMTEEEKKKRFGEAIYEEFPILNHHWREEKNLIHLGKTPQGTEIWVNREVLKADFIIGVGHIVPHRISGFSGGGKIIQPGICGEITTGQTHWLGTSYGGREIMGQAENPVRKELDAVAEKAGLQFIINAVQDGQGKMVRLVAGHPVKAHRAGCEVAREVYGVKIPCLADMVILDSFPADIDLWQAVKGIFAAELAVKEGGVIILVTPCPEGISSQHSEVLKYGYLPFEETKNLVERGLLKDLTAAGHIAQGGIVVKERARGIIVSPGISPEQKERLGLLPAETPQEALELALKIKGAKARILALGQGGEILPLLESHQGNL